MQFRRGQNRRKVKPGAGQITKVGEIVGRQELPEALLEPGGLQGLRQRFLIGRKAHGENLRRGIFPNLPEKMAPMKHL